jgi:uncharacterized small protein (DUF1192 family)
MDEDDFFSSRPQSPLALLAKEDLDPLSIDELQQRVELLRAEIDRVEQHVTNATRHRSAADELFKK